MIKGSKTISKNWPQWISQWNFHNFSLHVRFRKTVKHLVGGEETSLFGDDMFFVLEMISFFGDFWFWRWDVFWCDLHSWRSHVFSWFRNDTFCDGNTMFFWDWDNTFFCDITQISKECLCRTVTELGNQVYNIQACFQMISSGSHLRRRFSERWIFGNDTFFSGFRRWYVLCDLVQNEPFLFHSCVLMLIFLAGGVPASRISPEAVILTVSKSIAWVNFGEMFGTVRWLSRSASAQIFTAGPPRGTHGMAAATKGWRQTPSGWN